MTYLLDTNVCIRYLNGRSPAVRARLQALKPIDVALCSIVKSELVFGAQRSRDPQKALLRQQRFTIPFRSFPFDDEAAAAAGILRAYLANEGTPIGPNDLFIAAIALVNDCTLVTNNVREFKRIPDLSLVDWESE